MIKNIYVFYGGKSVEHEVSLMSAKNVINSLNKKYDIYPVFIDKEGRFLSLEKVSSVEDIKDLVITSSKKPLETIVDFLKSLKDDSIMFSLVHGSMGEDGTLQGFFDSLNLPYVGSSLKASAITFDKITTNEVLTSMGFEKAKFLAVLKSNIEEDIDLEIKKIEEEINYPLFVKPSNAGSSVGANKAGNRDELKNSLLEAKKYDDKILVEEFIDGRELEVSVMGLDDPVAAYPGEHIVSDHVFFDYNSKYFDQTTIINPRADLDEKTEDEIRKTAVKCFKALGLTAYSRVDIFLEKTGRILINEVNTIPGMTPTSLFPKSWEKIGNIPLTEILDKLIDYSLIAFEEKKQDTKVPIMKESLNLIKDLSKGELLVKAGQVDIDINGVSIDTRTLNKGNIYMPIIGENFDGHDFIEKAIENGAYATFWDKKHELPNIDIPIILVDDTKIALRTLARGYRLLVNPKVIAITGSNGKTTTKDMLYSSLKTKYKTHATKGNQNNDIGLPLTILSMEEDTEVLILEMGTESFGEIKILTEIGMPNYAMITNIADSHLNVLKTKENVATEKLDIVKGFVDSGIFYYNNDDPILRKKTLEILKGLDIKSIGKKEGSDFLIEDVEKTELGTSFKINGEEINLNLKGDHQVYNAAMAYAVLQNFNLNTKEINDAINNTEFTKMRNDCIKLKKIKLLDDSYKSNPQNLKAAIETLLEDKDPKRHILILSDMLDLGDNSKQLHYMVKDFLTDEIDLVLATGNESKEIIRGAKEVLGENKAIFFESKKELIHSLKELILEGDYVLVKGSRAMKMEEVVDYLKENF